MAQFVHNSMDSETVRFAVRVDKFSLVALRGYYESPEFGGERFDSQWNLVVHASEVDGYEDFIDIHLRRGKSDGEDEFVDLKMTVDDCFGLGALFSPTKRQFSFRGARDSQKVMSVPKSEFEKLRFVPRDTLTIRVEMVVYRENPRRFESESEFESSLGNSRTTLLRRIPWKALMCLVVAAGWYVWVALRFIVRYVAVPLLRSVVLPLACMLAVRLYKLLWDAGKEMLTPKPEVRRRNPRPYQDGHAMVPFKNGGYQQVAKYSPGAEYYGKTKKYPKMILDMGNGRYYECMINNRKY